MLSVEWDTFSPTVSGVLTLGDSKHRRNIAHESRKNSSVLGCVSPHAQAKLRSRFFIHSVILDNRQQTIQTPRILSLILSAITIRLHSGRYGLLTVGTLLTIQVKIREYCGASNLLLRYREKVSFRPSKTEARRNFLTLMTLVQMRGGRSHGGKSQSMTHIASSP